MHPRGQSLLSNTLLHVILLREHKDIETSYIQEFHLTKQFMHLIYLSIENAYLAIRQAHDDIHTNKQYGCGPNRQPYSACCFCSSRRHEQTHWAFLFARIGVL